MPTCCVYKCDTGSSSHNPGQSFPLPETPKLRNEWLDRINRENYIPTFSTRGCALHFSEDAFIPQERNIDKFNRPRLKRKLKPLAVPTLNMHSELRI